MTLEDDFGSPIAGDVAKTKIGSLGLAIEEMFGYWFDFGDDWWHQVGVVAITEPHRRSTIPKLQNGSGQVRYSMLNFKSSETAATASDSQPPHRRFGCVAGLLLSPRSHPRCV